jgi:hypothetical protein
MHPLSHSNEFLHIIANSVQSNEGAYKAIQIPAKQCRSPQANTNPSKATTPATKSLQSDKNLCRARISSAKHCTLS